MVRAFLAIDLPWELKKELWNLKKVEEPPNIKLKWVEEENFHITLRFFGTISENLVEKISKSCETVCQKIASFKLEIKEVGTFPEKGLPKVIWIGVENKENFLEELHKNLEKGFKSLKLEDKKEKFHPHITLIRVKEVRDEKALKEYLERLKKEAEKIKGKNFIVREIVLFKSDLLPKGPKYTPLKKISLKDV
ncbi:MAG: RNA 2',3'-cyclic phosphodiesterase [Caldimicrobium sp.]